jgi:Thioredoxin-like [2Fe-2S] ferredoxin
MHQKLEGQFLRWQNSPSGQPEFIQIQTATIIQSVRLGKNLRHLLADLLQPGMRLSLRAKMKKKYLQAKLVVLLPVGEIDIPCRSSAQPSIRVDRIKPVTVQICTSKHCCKNGSQEISKSLEQLAGKDIKVREVRCFGECRNAPVVKIGDRKYHRLSSQKVVALALKHAQQKDSTSSR